MLRYALLLSLALVSIARPAEAGGSEQKRFEKALEKYAIRNSVFQVSKLAPKAMCICLEGSTANRPGFVLWVDDIDGAVYCMVPFPFAPDGAYAGSASCEGRWETLGK